MITLEETTGIEILHKALHLLYLEVGIPREKTYPTVLSLPHIVLTKICWWDLLRPFGVPKILKIARNAFLGKNSIASHCYDFS